MTYVASKFENGHVVVVVVVLHPMGDLFVVLAIHNISPYSESSWTLKHSEHGNSENDACIKNNDDK